MSNVENNISFLKDSFADLTILLVDDTKSVNKSLSLVLANLCKEVYVATDGEEGVNQFLRHFDEIDLIISDIDMPIMSGENMLKEILKINPKIPIVIFSVYGDWKISDHLVKENVICYLHKPVVDLKIAFTLLIASYNSFNDFNKLEKGVYNE